MSNKASKSDYWEARELAEEIFEYMSRQIPGYYVHMPGGMREFYNLTWPESNAIIEEMIKIIQGERHL